MDELKKVEDILNSANSDIENANDIESINNVRNKYLAKKSELNGFMALLGRLSPEFRKTFGQKLNEVRTTINDMINCRIAPKITPSATPIIPPSNICTPNRLIPPVNHVIPIIIPILYMAGANA